MTESEKSAIHATMIATINWGDVFSIRCIDVVMLIAVFYGPIRAVEIAEALREKSEQQKRRFNIFKALMSTRTANLTPKHIDALNLVECEFHTKDERHKEILDRWRVYFAHLCDREKNKKNYDMWNNERANLLTDLLYEMSKVLGYSHDRAIIKQGAYIPEAYVNNDAENVETRRLWLKILRGEAQLPMKAEVYTNQPPAAQEPAKPPTQPPAQIQK